MTTVSVIIPVCNVEAYLRQCIDSVISQTLREIQIICVNDGSTDESTVILNEYIAKDHRIKILTQENSGQGVARNRGLTVAQGEYVYFMDADDELMRTDALELLVNEAKRENLDVLFFDAEINYDENMKDDTDVRKDMYIKRCDYSSVNPGSKLFALMSMNGEYSPSPCLAIYRRAFFKENNISFPSERIFYEDNIFMTRVLLAAKRASHRPWRFYLRKVHVGSTVTSKPTMRHLRGYLACYTDVCETLAREEWDSQTRRALLDRRVVYKLNVRRIADSYPDLVVEAKGAMLKEEYNELCKVLVYPLGEKIVNGFRCLREHGFRYTLRRILFGRLR
jgi:glycosyltransferase involved in cell wall biosynthesis